MCIVGALECPNNTSSLAMDPAGATLVQRSSGLCARLSQWPPYVVDLP